MKKLLIILTSLVYIIIVGLIDYNIGNYATLYLLYLLPIILVSYNYGIKSGIFITLFASVIWIIVDLEVESYYIDSFRVIDFSSRTIIISLISALVSSYKKANDELKSIAYIDQKTGAYNYRAFIELSEKEMAIAKRENLSCSLAYFDMNKFKHVNDNFGHSTGDLVLKKFSDITITTIRSSDIFCRIGGDEFILLFISKKDIDPHIILDRIKNSFESSMIEMSLPVTVSVGLTTIEDFSKNMEYYIQQADNEMYIDKNKK